MSPTVARALTVSASLVVAAGVVLGAIREEPILVLAALAASVAVITSWIVVRHDPSTPVGPALAWSSASIVLVLINDLVSASATSDSPLPLAELAGQWALGCWPINLVGVFALLLVFPTTAGPRLIVRVLPWVFTLGTVATIAGLWGTPSGDERVADDTGEFSIVALVGVALVGISLLLAVTAVIVRYIAGSPRERRQIRWLAFAGGAVVVLLAIGWGMEAAGLSLEISYAPFLLAIIILIPMSVAIAMVRHDLFDIDRLTSTSVSWLATAIVSAAIFGSLVIAASQFLNDVTALSSGIAAFITAIALLPVHRGLSGLVARTLDRDRYVALAAMERFSTDVRAGRREPEQIEAALRSAQGDDDLVVLIARVGGGWIRIDGEEADVGDGYTYTVERDGVQVARIVLGWNSARARRRISELAMAAFVPLEVTRLRLALREALHEASLSQNRLAHATADERRRLERDLHDGAQQRIIATGMRLRSLESRVAPAHAVELGQAVAELRDTVDELRRIAQGVRPSRLDEGLAAALSTVQASGPVPVAVSVDPLPDLDDTLAVTAYLVISEAVANALKHAEATRVRVHVTSKEGKLIASIADDGIGLPAGTVLSALHDRAQSIGGRIEVESTVGAGTMIRAVL